MYGDCAMKKTQILEILKNFKKTYVTFFSIVLFVSFGMAAFLGLDWSMHATADSFENYFSEGNLQEIEFSYPLGIRANDMNFLNTVSEFDEIEGRYDAFRFLNADGQKNQIHIYSVTDKINKITWLDGKMPENENEILVEKAFADKNGITVGNRIDFLPEEKDDGLLKSSSFTVSGIVKTSEYTSIYSDTYGVNPLTGCAVQGLMYLNKDAFVNGDLCGYSSVLIKCSDFEKEAIFTDAYSRNAVRIAGSVREKLEEHFSSEWISLTTKSANPSYISAKTIVDVFARLRIPLAGLFVIVGILVCFFAVARNVFDQAKLIGTKKALGFYKREIMFSLLLFSFLSTVLGVILGAVFARFVVEGVLCPIIQNDYPLNDILFVFNIRDSLLFGLFEAIIILLSTYFASKSVLKKSSNALLTGGYTHTFGEKFYMKTRGFKRLSVLGKVIVNNIFSEPRRVFSTIVGVMGITALIVCSMSLNNFIQGSFAKEIAEITKYDTVLNIKQDEQCAKEIESCLTSKGIEYSSIMSTYVTITTPDEQEIVTGIYVVDDDTAFLKLFDVHDGKHKIEHLNGLYSSVSYRNEFNPVDGDKMKLTDALGQMHEIEVAHFFDYYLIQNQLIIDRETYEREFGGVYNANSVILNRGEHSLGSLTKTLSEYDGFININDYYTFSKETFDGFATIFSLVVAAYIALAVLMAFIVIMNLIDMFIKEKKYELIVLMINGFRAKSAKAYIYVDTIILTLIGTLLGLALGIVMGNISLSAYNTASIYFEGGINAQASIIGVGLTFLLVYIVTVFSIKKINQFKLGDINIA